jgi:hypothetical protein
MYNIKSPSKLRSFALEVAERMKNQGMIDQAKVLDHCATLTCTTGWEWLGEIKLGIKKILEASKIPADIKKDLKIISKISSSSNPYK